MEDALPPDAAAISQAQAIVIVAGGRHRNAPEYGGETVNPLTLERLRYGARLARASGLPILLSGGAPSGGTAEALLMRDALERDFAHARKMDRGRLPRHGGKRQLLGPDPARRRRDARAAGHPCACT